MEIFKDRFDFASIVTHKFPMDKVGDAINLAKDPHNKGVKIVLAGKAC
jgi:threonine dehydrogenase-like Zn-dependent dehydrogenase